MTGPAKVVVVVLLKATFGPLKVVVLELTVRVPPVARVKFVIVALFTIRGEVPDTVIPRVTLMGPLKVVLPDEPKTVTPFKFVVPAKLAVVEELVPILLPEKVAEELTVSPLLMVA